MIHRKSLSAGWAGKEIIYYDSIDSTNLEAGRLARKGKENGTLVVAGVQTEGKGRRGRQWQSEEKASALMSLILRPDLEPEKASMLTLVQALSVRRAIEELFKLPAAIKWPNDILLRNKKVCGILTEMYLKEGYISSIIIGTGINVNQQFFPEEIAHMATSLKLEGGYHISIEEVIVRVNHWFESYYNVFMETRDLSFLMEEYNSHLISREREVKVLDPLGEYTGLALGINHLGELMVQKDTGEIATLYAGEVSVRGIYGYV